MAKRFTDTEIWFRTWFMEMTPTEKLAFKYIKDRCDSVGVWSPNMVMLKMLTGYDGTIENLIGKSNQNLELFNGKIFLPDFCHFQYGNLSKKSPPHRRYLQELENHGLSERVTQRVTQGVSNTPEEEEEEEDKTKENIQDVAHEEPDLGYNLNTILNALRNRYKLTAPNLGPFKVAIEKAIEDGFDRSCVQPTFEWLSWQTSWNYMPAFNTPNKMRENLSALYSKSQERDENDGIIRGTKDKYYGDPSKVVIK